MFYPALHSSIHTSIHTSVHTSIHSHLHSHSHSLFRLHLHAHLRSQLHSHLHTNLHSHLPSHLHAHLHTNLHAHLSSHLHAHLPSHLHVHTASAPCVHPRWRLFSLQRQPRVSAHLSSHPIKPCSPHAHPVYTPPPPNPLTHPSFLSTVLAKSSSRHHRTLSPLAIHTSSAHPMYIMCPPPSRSPRFSLPPSPRACATRGWARSPRCSTTTSTWAPGCSSSGVPPLMGQHANITSLR